MGRSLRKKDCLNKRVRTLPVRPADGMVGCVYEAFVPGEDCRGMGLRAKIKVCGAHSRSVKCIALLSSRGPRKSAMDSGGIRRLNLPLRPKARFSPGRKTPPGVSAPSAGLRPLNVSRVKCGANLVAATKRFREREIRYAFNAPLLRNCGRFDIGRPETRSGLDRVLPI